MKITITLQDTGKGKVSAEMTFDKAIGKKTKSTPASDLAFAALKAITTKMAEMKGKVDKLETTGLGLGNLKT